MQLKLNKLHQDLVSEDIQQSNFSNQDKKMIQQQLIMKEEEVNKLWLTGQENNYLIWRYSNKSNWLDNQYMKNIAKVEISVSSTFYLLSLIQQNNKDKIISTQSKKLAWDSKENHLNSYGHKVEINSSLKKNLEFQESVTHQLLLFSKPNKFMVDLKDHSVNKTWKTSSMILWKIKPNFQNSRPCQHFKQSKK